MKLEFADYMLMVDELAKHTDAVERATKPTKEKLIAQFEKRTKKDGL